MKSEAEASGEDEERSGDPPSRAFLERWADSHGDRFGSEVASLRLVTSPKLLKTDEYCGRLRSSTFLVALSPAATELLGEFLVTSGNAAVLKIFNERVTLEDASEDGASRAGAARLVEADAGSSSPDGAPPPKRARGDAAAPDAPALALGALTACVPGSFGLPGDLD